MSRPLRIEFPGALYHLTARGNARQDIYLDARDSRRFLGLLGEVCSRYAWRCFAYCLMTNHYHLVVETAHPNLAAGMRQLNGRYSQAFNHHHQREGHLFQGRYKAILVEREAYLLEVCRYVVLNPVRAGLARAPQAWRWSSYRATLAGAGPAWLAAPALLGLFAPEPEAAARAYAAFVAE
ncbi:MAG: transposase, partial [Proteobacteria bacterium]|nr:transposase [Pseudomonadota bacterium]